MPDLQEVLDQIIEVGATPRSPRTRRRSGRGLRQLKVYERQRKAERSI